MLYEVHLRLKLQFLIYYQEFTNFVLSLTVVKMLNYCLNWLETLIYLKPPMLTFFVLYDYFSLFTYLTCSLSFVLTRFCQGAFGCCYKLLRVSFQHYIL